MRRYKPRSRFVLPLIICALGFVVFYTTDEHTSPIKPKTISSDKPSAFLEAASLIEFDENGAPKLEIETSLAFYYEAQNRLESRTPKINYVAPTGENMKFSANLSEYNTLTEHLTLSDDVTLERKEMDSGPLTIKTETLQLDVTKRFISSKQAVTIQQNKSILSSDGIEASLDEKRLRLPSNVRGTYEVSE